MGTICRFFWNIFFMKAFFGSVMDTCSMNLFSLAVVMIFSQLYFSVRWIPTDSKRSYALRSVFTGVQKIAGSYLLMMLFFLSLMECPLDLFETSFIKLKLLFSVNFIQEGVAYRHSFGV